MKVLHVINRLGGGGAERLVSEMAPRLNQKKDISVDILLLTDDVKVYNNKLVGDGIKVTVIPYKSLYNPLNICHIKRHIMRGGYDIVHAHLFPTLYWTSLAAKLLFRNRPKFVMTEHSTQNRRRGKNYLRYMERFIYSSYDKIVSVSYQTRDNLVSWLELKESHLSRFEIIENGVDVDRFRKATPYKKSEICDKFTDRTILLCMVGNFTEAKDQATLIRAIEKLPNDVHLILVGRGPLKEYNRKLATSIGVDDRVHFLGFRDDVERILKTVDIVVQSSRWEGLGLAAIEGMAAGKPVIASNVAGLREIVDGSGFLFKQGNEIELSNIVMDIIRKNWATNDIIKNNTSIVNQYNITEMIKRYQNLYMELLN